MQIQDRVFLVTGGASGLGAAVASMIVEAGGTVVIADIGLGPAEVGSHTWFERCDVTSDVDAEAVVRATLDRTGALHGLVNCAGIAIGERVVGRGAPHGLASFTRVVGVNLLGTFNMIRVAAQAMSSGAPNADGERGVIVNTASVAAFDGQVGQAAYAASKAGICGMTLPIARELAKYGIRAVTVAPGLFETPMTQGLPAEVREALGRSVPFPSRLGRPAEFAAMVRQVIENPMLNGGVIRLDGAVRMAPR